MKPPITEKRTNKGKYLPWNSIRPKFLKKTSMPSSVKSLGYIKCYSSGSPRPVNSPSNYIRHNCQKICSWSRRPNAILEIRKKATFLKAIKFSKTNHRKKTNSVVVFSSRPFPTFLNTGTTHETCPQFRKQDSFRHILKSSPSMYETSGSQIFRITTGIQSGPNQIKYNHWWIKVDFDLFNHLGSYWNIMQFQISSRRENR